MAIIARIQVRAVLIALFAFYVAPILPLIMLSSVPSFFGVEEPVGERIPLWQSSAVFTIFWFWAIAPVGSGYFAAKLARQQPLLHGLAAGIVGGILAVLWVRGGIVFPFFLAILITSCGLFGGWLWRYRNPKVSNGL